jgi:integration host factor subunit beta
MTKSQLIEAVAASTQMPRKAVESAVNAIFDSLVDAMKREERVEIRGFGNFTIKHYGETLGRNPKTGTNVEVPAKRLPFFKVGKDLRERINGEG